MTLIEFVDKHFDVLVLTFFGMAVLIAIVVIQFLDAVDAVDDDDEE